MHDGGFLSIYYIYTCKVDSLLWMPSHICTPFISISCLVAVYLADVCMHGYRKVKDESSTGSSTSNRVRTNLTISIEAIEFDTAACELRVKGKNIQENQYVKMGAYHTIDLQLNQKFTLAKQNWDVISLDRLGDVRCCILELCHILQLLVIGY